MGGHYCPIWGRGGFRGWQKEAVDVLKKGVLTSPDDEGLKQILKKIEEDMDDPEDGKNYLILGAILFLAIILRKLKRRKS